MITVWLNLAIAAPPSTLPSRPETEAVPVVSVPTWVSPLRGMLSARHTADLPSLPVIEANGGVPALQWLADNDVRVGIRVRALDLLGQHAPDREVCLRASKRNDLRAIQAAGLRCLSQLPVVDAEVADAVLNHLSTPDPRVKAEAARAAKTHDLVRPHSHVRPRDLQPIEVESP